MQRTTKTVSKTQKKTQNPTISVVTKTTTSDKTKKQKKSKIGKSKLGGSYMKNRYLMTLLDPVAFPGVRIPDLISYPSVVLQTQTDIETLYPGNSSDTVGIALTPQFSLSSTVAINRGIFYSQNSTSPGNFNWANTPYQFQSQFASNFTAVRPVSACIEAWYTGPSLSDGGQFVTAIVPNLTNSSGQYLFPGYVSGLKTYPQSDRCTFKQDEGYCKAIWKPMDSFDLSYPAINSSDLTGARPVPTIFLVATGLPSGLTSTISFRVTINWECVPETKNFFLFSPQPSASDNSMLEKANNALSNVSSVMGSYVLQQIKDKVPGLVASYAQQKISNSLSRYYGNQQRLEL